MRTLIFVPPFTDFSKELDMVTTIDHGSKGVASDGMVQIQGQSSQGIASPRSCRVIA
jgi:hypothetical protein